MSTRPDMILQFAHYLGEMVRSEIDAPDLFVRAEVLMSLNGREPAWLVDPETNLLAHPRNLKPAPWIMPMPQAHATGEF